MNMDALPGFHSAVGGLYLEEKGIPYWFVYGSS